MHKGEGLTCCEQIFLIKKELYGKIKNQKYDTISRGWKTQFQAVKIDLRFFNRLKLCQIFVFSILLSQSLFSFKNMLARGIEHWTK